MTVDVGQLYVEVKDLRRGQGVRGRRLHESHPLLAEVSGIDQHANNDQQRQLLTEAVERHLSGDPAGREVLLVALWLEGPPGHDTLGRRLTWLSKKRHVSIETTRRRLKTATDQFVRAASTAPRAWSVPEDVGYVVVSLAAALTIFGDRTDFLQRRKIRAVQDEVREIMCCVKVQPPPAGEDEPTFAFHSGGVALDDYRMQRCKEVLKYLIRLPRPIGVDELYEFEVSGTVPTDRLEPQLVVVPCTPFEAIDLTVTFDLRRIPRLVGLVNGVMEWNIHNGPPLQPIEVDASGRVHACFPTSREGRAYGLAWTSLEQTRPHLGEGSPPLPSPRWSADRGRQPTRVAIQPSALTDSTMLR